MLKFLSILKKHPKIYLASTTASSNKQKRSDLKSSGVTKVNNCSKRSKTEWTIISKILRSLYKKIINHIIS